MRLTYTGIKNIFLDSTGNAGSADSTLGSQFDRFLGQRYQIILAELQDYQNIKTKTASTVASQQYYHLPPGLMQIESATVTVGSIKYPLTVINSQLQWDKTNQVLINNSVVPQFIFPRRDDYGIWPIPGAVYTVTLNYILRDRSLTTADYTTGTVTVTNNSQTLTGSGTTWTAAMVGRWVTTANDGYWYRISAFSSTTSLTIEEAFQGTTASSQTYTLGESPEIPEEGHILLAQGTTADFYAMRGDMTKATWWNNMFWTGDGANAGRYDDNVSGGVIGMRKRYAQRANRRIIRHKQSSDVDPGRRWGWSIS